METEARALTTMTTMKTVDHNDVCPKMKYKDIDGTKKKHVVQTQSHEYCVLTFMRCEWQMNKNEL